METEGQVILAGIDAASEGSVSRLRINAGFGYVAEACYRQIPGAPSRPFSSGPHLVNIEILFRANQSQVNLPKLGYLCSEFCVIDFNGSVSAALQAIGPMVYADRKNEEAEFYAYKNRFQREYYNQLRFERTLGNEV